MAQACLISTMAEWQLGHTEEARANLLQCSPNLKDKNVKGKSKDFGVNWTDWLDAEILRQEATKPRVNA